MPLSREAIVEGLRRIASPDDVVTDEAVLRQSSVDNFRKLENIFGVYTRPLPAAVVMARSTKQVEAILRFADVFGIPASRTTGAGGASLGAAICAAVATGAYPDLEAAAAAMASERETFAPDPGHTATYGRVIGDVYTHIRTATDPILERSYPIFR